MKEKIIKPILRFLLMWLMVILVFMVLGVIISVPVLIFNYFDNILAGVLFFLYCTFLVACLAIFIA